MQMEYNSLEILFRNRGLSHLSYKVITFLDVQTINAIIDFEEEQCNYQQSTLVKKKSCQAQEYSHMLQMLQSFQLLKQYMNKTDRSMYYCYYQEPEFIQIQKSHLQTITILQSTSVVKNAQFSTLYYQIAGLFKQIKTRELLSPDELDEITRLFVDPSLPLPAIKRDKEGIYCNSSFQLYLVGLRFPHYADKPFNAFEELQERIENEEQSCFKDFFEIEKNRNVNKKLYQNLHIVRYMPYEITFSNYDQLLIQNNTAHNLIVLIFALTDVWVDAVHAYLSSIIDPYYQFVELMSRYGMFKSLIIELEQSLGFVFHNYESLYGDTIKDSIFQSANVKPVFCYWRPAMTKWFAKMEGMHCCTTDVYTLLLTKLREDRIMERISAAEDTGNNSSTIIKKHAISLLNNLEMHTMEDQMKLSLQTSTVGESIIERFICNNDELTCESLVFQYIEYIVDLSVNEETVHWCGHSQHRLGKAFAGFKEQFLKYNDKFYDNLAAKVLGEVQDEKTRAQLLQQLVQNDVEYLEVKNVKPVILRNVVEKLNSHVSASNELFESNHTNTFGQLFKLIVSSHAPIIHMQFAQKDQKLKYFNDKAKICQSIQGEVKYFFMIPPQLSPQEILSKSINSRDNSEDQGSEEGEGYQYFSDEEEEMVEEGNEKRNREKGSKEEGKKEEGKKEERKGENNQMECQDEMKMGNEDYNENENYNKRQNENEDENQNQIVEQISQKLHLSQNSTVQSSQQGQSYDENETKPAVVQSTTLHPIFKTNSY